MNTQIFIRTYDGDAKWLDLCLHKLKEHARGFAGITIVAGPGNDQADAVALTHGIRPQTDEWDISIPNGYLSQQATKMRASLWIPKDADFVAFFDSDCVCHGDLHASDLFGDDGKPIMLHTPWSDLEPHVEDAWRKVTEFLVGQSVDYEFMRRLPFVYPVSVLRDSFAFFESTQGSMRKWLRLSDRFSEFNYLGAWAWFNAHDKFHWINTDYELWKQLPMTQYYSRNYADLNEARKGAGLEP